MTLKDFTFNQTQKRFEPISHVCAFCSTGVVENADDNSYITLYEEVKRTNLVVVKTVNFKKINVGLPRCASCKAIHDAAESKAIKIVLLIGGVLGLLIFLLSTLPAAILIAVITMGIVGYFFKNRMVENTIYSQGIFSVKDATEDSKVIQELLAADWSLEKPEA